MIKILSKKAYKALKDKEKDLEVLQKMPMSYEDLLKRKQLLLNMLQDADLRLTRIVQVGGHLRATVGNYKDVKRK